MISAVPVNVVVEFEAQITHLSVADADFHDRGLLSAEIYVLRPYSTKLVPVVHSAVKHLVEQREGGIALIVCKSVILSVALEIKGPWLEPMEKCT